MESYKDYLFVLEPSDAVKEHIKHCKTRASNYIGNYLGMRGTAHISLFNIIRQKPHVIQTFVGVMRSKLETMPPVALEIDGFNFFVHGENSATIYARIKPNYKADNWFALLQKQLSSKKNITPHITVTKTIPVDSFYKLWPELRMVPYNDSFVVDKLTILVRESHVPNAKYDVYERIYFKNTLRS